MNSNYGQFGVLLGEIIRWIKKLGSTPEPIPGREPIPGEEPVEPIPGREPIFKPQPIIRNTCFP